MKCSDCALLFNDEFPPNAYRASNLAYRCSKGKFDVSLKDGKITQRWFSWGGIVRPNQTVRASQTNCEFYTEEA